MRWAVENDRTTADIGGTLGTREVGEAIAERLRAGATPAWLQGIG